MIILSHRGYWKESSEKNKSIAFNRSFDLGFGTETDVRDLQGELVISHDVPTGNELTFEEMLQTMNGRNLPLAINIKADGLADLIKVQLEKYSHTNYFCFDMSIPDMIMQIKVGLNVFTGLSDILPTPVLLGQSTGVWLDCFNSNWYDNSVIDDLIGEGKVVCIVSADLHKRSVDDQWETIKKCKSLNTNKLMLCTDSPEKAKEYFNV